MWSWKQEFCYHQIFYNIEKFWTSKSRTLCSVLHCMDMYYVTLINHPHPSNSSFLSQTIKCLLIHPNPESALNEEAGRLLLEDYKEYASRAHLLTEIHAMGGTSGAPQEPADGPQPKKHAGDPNKRVAGAGLATMAAGINNSNSSSSGTSSSNTNIVAKKKTDKKRALRRL